MHVEAKAFMDYCQKHFPKFYSGTRVLDVGSGDLNGNNRYLFDSTCEYNGNDVHAGPNVTIVSKTSELAFPDDYFDIIVSTECFEHDADYANSMQKILKMLKPGGLFPFTCASIARPEHGTRKCDPNASIAGRVKMEGWIDYYRNLTIRDVDDCIFISDNFSDYTSYYNSNSKDLYFWGIKNGSEEVYKVPTYNLRNVFSTTHECVRHIQIIKVTYGNQDVTSKFIQHFYKPGCIYVPRVDLNSVFGDPAHGIRKILSINYKYRGGGNIVHSTSLFENYGIVEPLCITV